MANGVDSIVINESNAPEAPPVREGLSVQPLSEDGKAARVTVDPSVEQPAPKPAEGEEAPKAERPAWLPEGFDTPEALAEAYKALKSPPKETPAQTPEDAQKALEGSGVDLGSLTKEYAREGKLGDESLAKLEKAGITREVVDAYIDGQKARAEAYVNTVAESVGGKENLENLLTWAGKALSADEAAAANKVLQSMNAAEAKLVLAGLQTRYQAEYGKAPNLVRGEGVPGVQGVKPFRSNAEVVEAMKDPRYHRDEAYRQDVYARLRVSDYG